MILSVLVRFNKIKLMLMIKIIGIMIVEIGCVYVLVEMVGYLVLIIVKWNLNCLIIVCVVGLILVVNKLMIRLILIILILIVILDVSVLFGLILKINLIIKIIMGSIMLGLILMMFCIILDNIFIMYFFV